MSNIITGHLELIKKINRSLVLEEIKVNQPISRAQIAKILSLSKSTVSSIVDELLVRKLVVELGEGTSAKGGGRPASMLGFNPQSAYGIGVDIGGTKILLVITDMVGGIVFKKKIKTTSNVKEIVHFIKECLAESNIPEKKVIGMGIGVPGTVSEGVVVRAKALSWTNLKLQEQAEAHFSFPVFIGNDVNYAAMGERWLGSGNNSNELLFLAIGTGVGSAIITNGSLVYGHEQRAGEVAYSIGREDITNKRFNVLGESAVFEKKVSGTALSKFGYSTEEIFEKYSSGDQEVVSVIEEFVTELSIVIANAVSLLNPEKVIIGGGVSESMKVVLKGIQETVNILTPIRTEVKLASLGGVAGALGAIAFTFKMVEHS
jgi:glucokinase